MAPVESTFAEAYPRHVDAMARRLNNFLRDQNARSLWRVEVPDVGTLTAYQCGARVRYVMRYGDPLDGWDVFANADAVDVDTALGMLVREVRPVALGQDAR